MLVVHSHLHMATFSPDRPGTLGVGSDLNYMREMESHAVAKVACSLAGTVLAGQLLAAHKILYAL